MTKNQNKSTSAHDRAASLEGRVALRMTAYLDETTRDLPFGVSERLRVGREQAVLRAQAARKVAVQQSPVLVHLASALAFGRQADHGWRLASFLPLVALVAGLVAIHQYHDYEQILLAAELDVAILVDELPPAAYRDPGFTAFLQAQDAR